MIRLPIAEIKMDVSLQPRAALDTDTIAAYAEEMRQGDHFPPVVVFYDGSFHWLADGYHRINAALAVGETHISVTIKEGSFDAARWYSYGTNASHGLRRTNADKRRAVEAALSHPQAASKSESEIARHCGVDHKTVTRCRQAILGNSQDTREVTRNGTTYAMNVASIGNGHVSANQEPPPFFEVVQPAGLMDKGIYTLDDWEALMPEIRHTIIEAGKEGPTKKKFNGQESDNIEWARWSWNPVTGCYHDCVYCYARDIANRHYVQKFEAAFHPDRLAIPTFQQPPTDAAHLIGYRNVFTCSMADLFGKWVPQLWIDAVLDVVRESPQWNFLFLTKFPIRLAQQTWPDNAWVGCSVDRQARVASAERAFGKVKAGIKWLSCEPLLEPLTFTSLEMFDWIVIGGQSKASQVPAFQPQWEWVESLVNQARAAGCKVYFKTNLLVRPKEYPFEVQP